MTKTLNKTNKNNKNNKNASNSKEVVNENEIGTSEEVQKFAWGGKYEDCKVCHTTDLKHYSGGNCTRCYTEMRNERLGLGKFNPEMNKKRLEKLEAKKIKLEQDLKELNEKIKELA